jgi:hypothetical protein
LLRWTSCPQKLLFGEVAAVSKPFTPQQEQNLKKAFSVAQGGNGAGISLTEIKEVLRAVDVDVDGEEGDKFFENMNLGPTGNSGTITFDELKEYVDPASLLSSPSWEILRGLVTIRSGVHARSYSPNVRIAACTGKRYYRCLTY